MLVSAALFIFSFIFRLDSGPKGHGETSFLIVGVIYAGVGVWFGARHGVREWLVALCLSSSYLLMLGYVVYSLCRYNQIYGGRFWSNKFYLSPVFFYPRSRWRLFWAHASDQSVRSYERLR